MPKAVIMAGGQGERFWPLTHKTFPKYRIRFDGKQSLLQSTYRRLLKVYGPNNIYVVTTRPHARMIREELPALRPSNSLIEPFRNNTAAAIYFSCAVIARDFGPEEIVSFFPADHLIKNELLFKKTMRDAIGLAAKKDRLVTIGVQPGFPSTAYGYIQKGPPIQGVARTYRVKRFVEKPNRSTAERYLKSGDFLWNGGIFTWRSGVFLSTMNRFCADFAAKFNLRRLDATYKHLPDISIDVALMEKADNIAVVATEMDWCDMGDWDMLHEKSSRDKSGNYSDGLARQKEMSGSLIVNATNSPVIALGVSDLIIVKTKHGTLICPRGRAQEAALLSKSLNS